VNIVAFETSSETISVAVARDGQIVSTAIADAGQQSGELALPTMHSLLAGIGLEVDALDLVVFGQGPGSFTGVRVACGLAQGLAYGLGKRVIALPSTLALAAAAGASTDLPILVAIDARMGEIYLAAYGTDAAQPTGYEELIEPCLVKPDAIAGMIAGRRNWQGAGSAFYVPSLSASLSSGGRIAAPVEDRLRFPRAEHLLTVALRMIERSGLSLSIAPHDAQPLYVRHNVAQTIAERRTAKATKAADASEAAGAAEVARPTVATIAAAT